MLSHYVLFYGSCCQLVGGWKLFEDSNRDPKGHGPRQALQSRIAAERDFSSTLPSLNQQLMIHRGGSDVEEPPSTTLFMI